jgi:hypothetical protein
MFGLCLLHPAPQNHSGIVRYPDNHFQFVKLLSVLSVSQLRNIGFFNRIKKSFVCIETSMSLNQKLISLIGSPSRCTVQNRGRPYGVGGRPNGIQFKHCRPSAKPQLRSPFETSWEWAAEI